MGFTVRFVGLLAIELYLFRDGYKTIDVYKNMYMDMITFIASGDLAVGHGTWPCESLANHLIMANFASLC